MKQFLITICIVPGLVLANTLGRVRPSSVQEPQWTANG